jgi:hypothetical protein
MLEIVAKRAALRPSEPQSLSSLPLENISLPVLPPQTTINPLLQHQYNQSPAQRYQPFASNRSNVHHTFSSQSHNQEHDVSSDDNFLFNGTEDCYLRTNLSLLHDCEIMLEQYERQSVTKISARQMSRKYSSAHTVLVIIEFLILYIGILLYAYCYSYTKMGT